LVAGTVNKYTELKLALMGPRSAAASQARLGSGYRRAPR